MIFTHHPDLKAILGDDHAPAEMVVNNDLQPVETIGRLPTFDELQAAFDGGYGNRLNAKVLRAKADGAVVLLDVEPLQWRPGPDLAHYSAVLTRIVKHIRDLWPGCRIMLYAHCGRDDRMLTGQARIKEGHRWWSMPRIADDIKARYRRAVAVAGQLRRSHGKAPRIGVYDLVDVISPVCYQSPDARYLPADLIPPTLERAMADHRPVVPILSTHTYAGELVDLGQLDQTCKIIKGYGLADVYMHHPWDEAVTPAVAERVAIVQEQFGR